MKKLTKKLVMLAVCGLSIGAVNAQTTWNIGTPTATDVKAVLSGGTLTISGSGAMQDFPMGYGPWYSVSGSITALVIDSGVTNIGNYAFSYCSHITGTLTIPNSVSSIGDGAFQNCWGFTGALTIPTSVVSIGGYVFNGCYGFTSVTIPSSVTSIGSVAFISCSGLTAIDVDPANLNYSSDNGVLMNKTKTVLLEYPAGKTGGYTVSNSVTSIKHNAFDGCQLTFVIIGNAVDTIEYGAFANCQNLVSVTIPNSVSNIDYYAFGCNNLASITCLNPDPTTITMGSNVFVSVNKGTCVLKVPCGSVGAYQTAAQWSDFTHIEAIPLTILATAGTGGTISPNGTITVNCADSQTFTFSANSGYEISQVLIDNLNNFPAVAAGSYTFTNVAANHKIEVYFKSTVGIVGTQLIASLPRIYPNPTNGQLRVYGDIWDSKDREIRIFNVVGQVVFTSQLSNLSPETTIDISHLSAGLYFLKVNGKMVQVVKE